jgi:hypothetical protein
MQYKKIKEEDFEETFFDKNYICLYDIEYKQSFDIDVNFFLFKDFEGISQLNFNNCLYLCGSPRNSKISGSYLLKYDPKKLTNPTQVLINSIYSHYLPIMISIKNEYIMVIGGEDNLKCEWYNINNNKWKNLANLPEERFKGNAIYDDDSDSIYLFGGYDSNICSTNLDTNKLNKNSILRLAIASSASGDWEYIIINNNSRYLERNSFSLIKSDKNTLLIIGGIGNQNEKLDSIVEYNVNISSTNLSRSKLVRPSSFIQSGGCDFNSKMFYIFDDEFHIHIINNNNFNIDTINYIGDI